MVAYLSEVERDRKAQQAQSSGLSEGSKGKKRAREDEGLGLTIDVDSAEKEADAYCPALPPEGGDAMVEDGDEAEQEDNVDYAALARETVIYRAECVFPRSLISFLCALAIYTHAPFDFDLGCPASYPRSLSCQIHLQI